jgi:hypothetical protein
MVENRPLVIRTINDTLGCFTEFGIDFSTLKGAHIVAKSIKKRMGPWDAGDIVYVGYKDSLEFKTERLCPHCRELAERQGFLKKAVDPEKEGELQKPVDPTFDCGTIPVHDEICV